MLRKPLCGWVLMAVRPLCGGWVLVAARPLGGWVQVGVLWWPLLGASRQPPLAAVRNQLSRNVTCTSMSLLVAVTKAILY